MNTFTKHFKLAAGAAALIAALGFTQAHQPAAQEQEVVYGAQGFDLDAADEYGIALDYQDTNSDLGYLFFIGLHNDDKDIHVVVDTVDYSVPYSTTVELYIADDTQVTRELESQINHKITDYFAHKQEVYFAEQKEINDDLEAEYAFEARFYGGSY